MVTKYKKAPTYIVTVLREGLNWCKVANIYNDNGINGKKHLTKGSPIYDITGCFMS